MSDNILLRVPADWKHPKSEDGNFIPLTEREVKRVVARWQQEKGLWVAKNHPTQIKVNYFLSRHPHEKWPGYVPASWTSAATLKEVKEYATCFQWYETISEGTPISPVLGSKQQAIEWLATHKYCPNEGEFVKVEPTDIDREYAEQQANKCR